jgi:hypothetical protein
VRKARRKDRPWPRVISGCRRQEARCGGGGVRGRLLVHTIGVEDRIRLLGVESRPVLAPELVRGGPPGRIRRFNVAGVY